MKNTHWIKKREESFPQRKISSLLTRNKFAEIIKEDRSILRLEESDLKKRIPDFDLWFSWN